MAAAKPQAGSGRVRLGELLVKAGVITQEQLTSALDEQTRWGGRLGDMLVRMNFLSEDIFARALSKQLGLTRADLSVPIPPAILAALPADIIEAFEILPVALLDDGRTLAVATSDPLNFTVLDHVRAIAGKRVVPYVAGAASIRNAISRLGHKAEEAMEFVSNKTDGELVNGPVSKPKGFPADPNPELTARLNPFVTAPPPARRTTLPPMAPPVMQPQRRATDLDLFPPSVPPPARAPAPAAGNEMVTLTALIELLLEKKVITLEEYLARIKR